MDVPGLLHLLKAEPTLLPVAPDAASSEAIEQRRTEDHACLVCGAGANTALIVQDPHRAWQGKRWLDLCWADFNRVRSAA